MVLGPVSQVLALRVVVDDLVGYSQALVWSDFGITPSSDSFGQRT